MKEEAKKLKEAIGVYCRAAVSTCLCNADDCEWCAVNNAYEMAEMICRDEEEEIEEDD